MRKENPMKKIRLIVQRTDYSDLISLLDQRIRSERARMAAFRGNNDHANAHAAEGRRERLLQLRNSLVEGCDPVEVSDG